MVPGWTIRRHTIPLASLGFSGSQFRRGEGGDRGGRSSVEAWAVRGGGGLREDRVLHLVQKFIKLAVVIAFCAIGSLSTSLQLER